ncbi:transposase, partial [Intrasporangium chromatireducens Q5-1]
IIEVHGHQKQGAGFGYSKVRGLNAFLATLTTAGHAPVIVAQRLRKGSCGSPRGAARLIGDAVKQARRLLGADQPVLVRMDSAFFGGPAVRAALAGGADVSVTVRLTSTIKTAIAGIDESAWTTIEYTDAIRDEATGAWISRAEVAEIDFTAFAAQKTAHHVPGRLVVRRIPDLNAEKKKAAGQGTLFDVWRFHAFFTTVPADTLDTVTADQTHRHHAIIEQVHADLKNSALAHLPSGKFTANAAWLVLAVIAFNLTRAAAVMASGATRQTSKLAKASTATVRRTLITVPARVASSARRITLHLPESWPWHEAWTRLFDRVADPPMTAPS